MSIQPQHGQINEVVYIGRALSGSSKILCEIIPEKNLVAPIRCNADSIPGKKLKYDGSEVNFLHQ